VSSGSSPRLKIGLTGPSFSFVEEIQQKATALLTPKVGMTIHYYALVEEIQQKTTADLTAIPKEEFQRCFQQWHYQWSKHVCAEGQYLIMFHNLHKLIGRSNFNHI
jgi:hypothetical protein